MKQARELIDAVVEGRDPKELLSEAAGKKLVFKFPSVADAADAFDGVMYTPGMVDVEIDEDAFTVEIVFNKNLRGILSVMKEFNGKQIK